MCFSLFLYVGSRFSDRAHYNEFVESGSKSWALIRRRLVSRVKNTQNWAAQRPKEKGPLTRGRESPTLLGHTGVSFLSLGLPLLLSRPPYFGWSLLLYIPLFRSSSSYTCQSSMLILKCTSHRTFFLALCKLLWPPCPVQGLHPHQWGQGISCGYLIRWWQLLLGLSLHHSPMASP